MSQCVQCFKPCAENAICCDVCQARSEKTFSQEIKITPAVSPSVTPLAPFVPEALVWAEGSITLPYVEAEGSYAPNVSAQIPHSPFASNDQHAIDQTASKLSEAARGIKADESGIKRLRPSTRLAPLRDISAEIQRASTPHLRVKRRSAFDTLPDLGAEQNVDPNATELVPWSANEAKEKERDLWANSTDPFIARARPTAAAAAHIEEEDIRRVQLEERATLRHPTIQSRRRRFFTWRLIIGAVIILALSALLIDGLLLSFAIHRPNPALLSQGGPPTLTLSTNMASLGAIVSVQLLHFVPFTSIVLTRDIQQSLPTTERSSALSINAHGQAEASFSVSSSWGSGTHLIVAEDVATRDTASALLQIDAEGPSRPPHLLLASSSLDLGSAVQGADTIQPLTLNNTGSGSITWSASSNRPWLLVAPLQGTFGAEQTISLAAQRSHMQPGTYQGTITISSSVGAPEQLAVTMTVSSLPPDAGPVISLTPPLLSFTTMDSSATPVTQVLTLSNPGSQRLSWSLDGGQTVTTTPQNTFLHTPGIRNSPRHTSVGFNLTGTPTPWLSTDVISGSLASGQSTQIHLTVHSQNLLPGAYMGLLTFSAAHNASAYDTPQLVGVALTVQPHCGLLTSTGNLSFTAVAGQSNPSTHLLNLNTTTSCASGPLNWQALSSSSWLAVSPASGQIKGTNSSVTAIGVNTANLAPGKYTGLVTFQAGKNTSTVMVQLNLQPRPAPSEPLMGASPLSLNFSTIQAQANPTGQVLTITNNGGSPLKWHTTITTPDTNWISVSPASGSIAPGSTGQLTVNVVTTNLAPGAYTAQVALSGDDTRNAPASGSPQTVPVSLVVQPPCSLAQPSASSLLFNGMAGGANPLAQMVTFVGAGSCAWPLKWHTTISPIAPWLTLISPSDPLNSASQEGMLTTSVNTAGLLPGTYTTSVKISATDEAGTSAEGSPQTFSVTLTVLQPCVLQLLPTGLVFNASQGAAAPPNQALILNETGSCGGGVAWTASTDAGSSSWLNLSTTSGRGTGGGDTIFVSVVPGNLAPATYSGQITISASNKGVVLQDSPQTLHITFTVTGYSVNGSVVACASPAPNCTTSQNLSNATVSLLNNSGATIAIINADVLGNFTFSNIPLGTYTLRANGNVGDISYIGTTTVTVNGTTSGVSVQAF